MTRYKWLFRTMDKLPLAKACALAVLKMAFFARFGPKLMLENLAISRVRKSAPEVLGAFPVGPRVAVIVAFPRLGPLPSVRRVLARLQYLGFETLLVVNDSPFVEEWVKELEGSADCTVVRSNAGRDFGAYKFAITELERRGVLSRLEKLLVLNDSIYFPPGSMPVLDSLAHMDATWGGISANLVEQTHVQSFAYMFGPEVVSSPAFARYWDEYQLTNRRRRLIHGGELALSRVLLAEFGGFSTILNSDEISHLINERPNVQRDEFEGIRKVVSMRRGESAYPGPLSDEMSLRALADHHSVIHYLGTYLTREWGFPLKLELSKSGIASPDSMCDALMAQGCGLEELAQLKSVLESVALGRQTRLRRLWIQLGLL